MKRKNAVLLLLVCGLTLACSPMLAQGAQRAVAGPYRLTFTMTEMDGNKRINSQRYVVAADADAPPTDLRLGTDRKSVV